MIGKLKIISLAVFFVSMLSCTKGETDKVIFVGDSIVRNWDVERFFPYLQTENLGVDGYRIEDCQSLNIDASGGYVVLLVGTNNLPHKVDNDFLSYFIDEYRSLISRMEYKRLFCISILPKCNYDCNNIITINKAIKEETGKMDNVEFIDVFDSFYYDGSINPEYTIDGIHLSYKGYELLTSKVSNAICK